ncbi:hypothetical protein Ssi03_65620 [Sphaerisporangium siamense]|uniref:Pantothenate kinase type III n=1 Tax=Sphaerisporangium siamense TaxID=795645 RepID=A0A7W7GCH6_9ACTN|nr:hypothetical protein [Sphaerisporangium siamense]MBB4706073.1 pantothenate kinase type III [Sphaerisporangium siamense]GII88572.1 hypothetical protein Ssi03_65620 [Sphaerisporangium siamense]
MTAVHPARSLRQRGAETDPQVLGTDAIIDALARREPAGEQDDIVVSLLRALTEDVDQRLSSVSITPST